MIFFIIFDLLLIILTIGDVLQAKKLPHEMCRNGDTINGDLNGYPTVNFKSYDICDQANMVSVQSVYVAKDFLQLFIVNSDKSITWNAEARIWSEGVYLHPEYLTKSTNDQSGRFKKVGAFGGDGQLKQVSASFLQFSDCVNEFGYLISGLSAHEFVIRNRFYEPSGKVRPITDFFKEGDQKLLKPEDKLEEVVSVSLIKWVEKDHGIYKIILKTVTKKLVKSYFKVTTKGEVTTLNGEPFLPSAEVMQDANELNLVEEAALYHVRDKDKLSIGYQFIKSLAFPIYYDYNPETNTYKEYPMRTKNGFNADLETLAGKINLPYWNRYIVSTEAWFGCPVTTFCLGPSFDAVFNDGVNYFAIYKNLVYSAGTMFKVLSLALPLTGYLFDVSCTVDAAFALGETAVFFIKDDIVYYRDKMETDSHKSPVTYDLKRVFPDLGDFPPTPVAAVITLDKGQETSEVTQNDGRNERAAQEDILKKMVYMYLPSKDGGEVYQFQVTDIPKVYPYVPKFKLIAKKAYKDVNAALPLSVSLVFTTEDKVVTMVDHFMIEQSPQSFFTQTESQAKFTLVDKYFGCQRENLEKELSKEFVQKYIKFAAPKPGMNVEPDLSDAGKRTKPREPAEPPETTSKSHCPTTKDSETDSSSTENSEKATSTSSSENSEEVSKTSTEKSNLEPTTSSSKHSKTESSSADNSNKVSSTEKTLGSENENEDEDKNDMKSGATSAKISSFIQASVMLILIIFCCN